MVEAVDDLDAGVRDDLGQLRQSSPIGVPSAEVTVSVRGSPASVVRAMPHSVASNADTALTLS